MMETLALIMAAGKGTRLKSDLPKVLHPLFGRPLVARVLDALIPLSVQEACVIVGHGRNQVETALSQMAWPFPVRTAVQEPQLGTGHAVQEARAQLPHWNGRQADVLILSGDVPLLQPDTLQMLLQTHRRQGNHLTLLTAELADPTGYGRVLMQKDAVRRIVEERDASVAEKQIRLVNTGIYCLKWGIIAPLLDRLSNRNAQGEFYLTDVIALAVSGGLQIGMAQLNDPEEMTGVNSRADLALCHDILNRRTQARLMAEGVSVLHPASTLIGPDVRIGADTTVLPGCYLVGDIAIGKHCTIGPHTTMTGQVAIGDHVQVMHSVVRDTRIGDHGHVGPFAQLRDGVELSHHVHIGNFVEIKKSTVDHHTNAAHLAYIGDASVGHDVNIGAGTITANYDPIRDIKERTIIGDGAKIGSNSVLIAPVSVGEHASVAAGSVITKNVAPWDLAIARARQSDISGWVRRVKSQAETSR